MYNNDIKRRECLNDILIYDPLANSTRKLEPSGVFLEGRRYHTSCILGTNLIVHGGLNDKDIFLGGIYSVNIYGINDRNKEFDKTYRWVLLQTINQGLGPTAYHTCNLVLDPERYKLVKYATISTLPDVKSDKIKLPFEGIYYFGGRNPYGATNDLYILKIGRNPLEWVKAETKGRSPPPRYSHSSSFFSERSVLVIFGGRNDAAFEASGSICMNDIWILAADKMEWIEWDISQSVAEVPESRYAHASAILGRSIVIFGGLNDENYCNTSIFEIKMGEKEDKQALPDNNDKKNNKLRKISISQKKKSSMVVIPKDSTRTYRGGYK